MGVNKKLVVASSCAIVFLCGLFAGGALAGDDEPEVGLPAAVLVKAINAASKANGGDITEVDVEREHGQTFVSVEVLAKDGHKYDINVEAGTNHVALVEKDIDDEEKNN